ncbi:uncharacterized protein LOC128276024 [Anopheles cruzii]|uniref:uncharacterized protein LOC128276024 n=1 Tax=Anopheles cruzii TaxID=68878 RepID=UPI0022EC62CC|nr:uncharacterized protein LOC128276024 [Anopheles cruzii]
MASLNRSEAFPASQSLDLEDCDEETQALIADSLQLADELVAITAYEELARSRSAALKDIELDVEHYCRTVLAYKESLDRLSLLENGVLHALNRARAPPANIDSLLHGMENKMDLLRKLLRESMTVACPSMLDRESLGILGQHREQLNTLQQQLERAEALIDGIQVRELAKTMEALERFTKKLNQEMDSMLKLNTVHSQMVVGFSKKVSLESPPDK